MTPWGLARVEVIASKEHIASELQRGVPVKQIHDALVSAGRVSVTYNSFRRQIQAVRDELETLPAVTKPENSWRARHSPARQPTAEKTPPQKSEARPGRDFRFDPSCKAEDFF